MLFICSTLSARGLRCVLCFYSLSIQVGMMGLTDKITQDVHIFITALDVHPNKESSHFNIYLDRLPHGL
jgi:hypothetical protein